MRFIPVAGLFTDGVYTDMTDEQIANLDLSTLRIEPIVLPAVTEYASGWPQRSPWHPIMWTRPTDAEHVARWADDGGAV